MNVAFVNENTLGHTSYLPRFADCLTSHPEWNFHPIRIDATPLPPELRGAERGIRGLSRFGLDGQITRWRRAASAHAATQLQCARRQHPIDAIVVNTQSVGLAIPEQIPDLPCWVALDATFEQLARTPWFAPTSFARWFQPITLHWLRRREKSLFRHSRGFLPWSSATAESLQAEYGIPKERIHVPPPSIEDPKPTPRPERPPSKLRILFIGGDFVRKGGPRLVDVWRQSFRGVAELHVVTRSPIEPESGLRVHVGVEAGSQKWKDLWNTADLFVFPSQLETFGIVLIEAMAFGVPVISANTGAAQDLLGNGDAGILLPSIAPDALRESIQRMINDRELRVRCAAHGRARFTRDFELSANTRRLTHLLRHP